MDSIGPECTELKHKYEACFNRWYSEKFLKGETRDECEPLFKAYKACLDVQFMGYYKSRYIIFLCNVEGAKGEEN